MAMQTVQNRRSPEQHQAIDRQIKDGKYQSRSEAIRDYLRKAEFFDALAAFRLLAAKAGLKDTADRLHLLCARFSPSRSRKSAG